MASDVSTPLLWGSCVCVDDYSSCNEGPNLCTIIALFGVQGIAMLDFGLRLNRKSISTILLSFYSSLLVTLTRSGMLYGNDGLQWSDRWTQLYLFRMIVLEGVGLVLLMMATCTGELSVISLFR